MAKNTGSGYRRGPVTNRTQVYNEKTKQYVKRDTKTGKFVATKDTKFKNVRDEAKLKERRDKSKKD